MDIKAYISSGVLEQYAFDLLSPAERREVEANLEQHPALVEELHKVEYAIEKYLSIYQEPVSPDVRQRIAERLNKVTPDPPLRRATATAGGGSDKGVKSSANLWLFGLLILNLIAAAWLFYKNQKQDVAYAELQTEYEALQQKCEQTEGTNRSLLIELNTIRQTGNQLIQMRGTDNAPAAIASVIYNPETETSYLDVIDLPTPPTDKQYQLWAIVDGTPVDMGVFDVQIDAVTGLREIPFIEGAQAFAVTLEPRGGSEAPTLEEMVTIGNVVG